MAQDLNAAGAELPELMTAGRWGQPHHAGPVHRGPGRRQGSRGPVLPGDLRLTGVCKNEIIATNRPTTPGFPPTSE